MLDLNETSLLPPPYDVEQLSRALAACANRWVREFFPRGRIDGDVWRLADITGRAPRNTGSCIIRLDGDHAGEWFDHSTGNGGGPLSTLKEATGLEGRALFARAAEVAGAHLNGAAPRRNRHDKDRHAGEIALALKGAVPCAGTLAEHYFAARGISVSLGEDVRFNPLLTHWASQTGMPALISIIRHPDGTPTGGIHRTYLREDGSWHTGKKMLGPSDGVVMLAPIGAEGELAVGEGIESTAAGMRLFGLPGWAALSAGGLRRFGKWLAAHPGALPLRRLLILADAGPEGESAAAELRSLATEAGIAAEIRMPRGGDDFADDLAKGLLPEAAPAMPDPPAVQIDFEVAARTLSREDMRAVAAFLRRLAAARLPTLETEAVLKIVRRQARLSTKAMGDAFREARREAGAASADGDRRAPGWLAKLICFDSCEPKPILANVATMFREAPEWADALAYDQFANRIVLRRPPPWEGASPGWRERRWTDTDELAATEWTQNAGIAAPKTVVFDAAARIAAERMFHPVRDYLCALSWDRKPRLDNWLIYYLGAEPGVPATDPAYARDMAYLRAIGPRWLISAVARVMSPGVKADCVLILEGDQGLRKSTALRVLGDPLEKGWFTDDMEELGSQNSAMQAAGVWVIELSELSSLKRAQIDKVKAFLSRQVDRFRPPYGRQIVEQPRQCVLCGTVNPEEYLTDPTGNRRYWPARCTAIDLDALRRDRDQLWAEAVARFRRHERWWIDSIEEPELTAAAGEHQAMRTESDSWDAPLAEYLRNPVIIETTIAELLSGPLGIADKARWDRSAQTRIGTYLRRHGWYIHQIRSGPRRGERVYRRPEPQP